MFSADQRMIVVTQRMPLSESQTAQAPACSQIVPAESISSLSGNAVAPAPHMAAADK